MAHTDLASNHSITGACSLHINGTHVVFWTVYDQVWLILSLLVITASVEHVAGMSKALRCFPQLL